MKMLPFLARKSYYVKLVPRYVVVNKGDGTRYQKKFYDSLMTARIKSTFMLQVS